MSMTPLCQYTLLQFLLHHDLDQLGISYKIQSQQPHKLSNSKHVLLTCWIACQWCTSQHHKSRMFETKKRSSCENEVSFGPWYTFPIWHSWSLIRSCTLRNLMPMIWLFNSSRTSNDQVFNDGQQLKPVQHEQQALATQGTWLLQLISQYCPRSRKTTDTASDSKSSQCTAHGWRQSLGNKSKNVHHSRPSVNKPKLPWCWGSMK